ncbi:hypothetical protein ACJQWK_09882 [Exserohilum turcicum]|uniref:Peptidase A1 domain-containing protein n=1 Tax=Exserohilum turcicum (strain 28A) TaxID=671987 RepID=R0JT36_EXST2|nr:uncharacterized protein SETTUDRAFT_166154 [Exserohilum turcica Et28A]EOA80679.1 hypothetical protein SETTUDRAFT_166154 [Exserohilum turcica Et28A]
MVRNVNRLLAIAGSTSAAVLDLPINIVGSYSSVQLDLGTPPKLHQYLFDTGSSTLWTVSTNCTEASCKYGNEANYKRQYYNASASSTAVDLDSSATTPYLGGQITGVAYKDVITIPGGSLEWNQTFLAVNESDWRFITADGFLGLGFSSIAEDKTSTLVETLMWDGKLDKPRFSVYYGNHLDKQNSGGLLTIGGSHEDKYVDGEVVYTPLTKTDTYELWACPLRSVNVLVAQNATSPNSTVETRVGKLPTTALATGTYPEANVTWPMFGTGRAVFDTGAGRVSVPKEIAGAIYYNLGWDMDKLLSGEQRFTCEAMNASWAITFTFGEGDPADDVSFSLRGDEFLDPEDPYCQPPLDDSTEYGFALIGTTFLQRYFSVFDFGADKVENYKPRVGFGKLKDEYAWKYGMKN